MANNTFGTLWCLTTFGESHGPALGGVVDGCPAGIALDATYIQAELDKRKPGGVAAGLAGTARKESDTVTLLSGVFEGYTTGTPIGFTIANEDQRSRDYGPLATAYRPGHADCTYDAKYGRRDYRGGGRSSGRETAVRVAGGAIAQAFLATLGVRVMAATVEMGGIAVPHIRQNGLSIPSVDMDKAASLPYFAGHADVVPQWEKLITEVRGAGDTIGGIVQIEAHNVPAGLGEPVFDKLDARLAAALMSVGAVKGVEVGTGFAAARLRGSAQNDSIIGAQPLRFASNNAGGILGGISSGQNIVLRVAVKPIPSIAQEQNTVDASGTPLTLRVGGRHDICAIPRVVPVLRAMTALVLADAIVLQSRMGKR